MQIDLDKVAREIGSPSKGAAYVLLHSIYVKSKLLTVFRRQKRHQQLSKTNNIDTSNVTGPTFLRDGPSTPTQTSDHTQKTPPKPRGVTKSKAEVLIKANNDDKEDDERTIVKAEDGKKIKMEAPD